jgi:hypothetical protein
MLVTIDNTVGSYHHDINKIGGAASPLLRVGTTITTSTNISTA